ncbi:hypothetical protein CBM2589_A70212 [Cupriavidus taiwanensis]|uniref:Uncharacterized protein n=1 Tax=Cupriavidus taiwanensis TaxID=164546 RepID=A0A375C787_9BURK|nr:hypothetical protein CBM2589_A70212 [Cupriavidus taiwanensis]
MTLTTNIAHEIHIMVTIQLNATIASLGSDPSSRSEYMVNSNSPAKNKAKKMNGAPPIAAHPRCKKNLSMYSQNAEFKRSSP